MNTRTALLIAAGMFVLGLFAGRSMPGFYGASSGSGLTCETIATAITSANMTEQQRTALVEKLAAAMGAKLEGNESAIEKFRKICGKK